MNERLKRLLGKSGRVSLVVGLMFTASHIERDFSATLPESSLPVSTPWKEQIFDKDLTLLDRIYPELQQKGLTLKSVESFFTESKIPTIIYNFTGYQLNPAVIFTAYGFFESLGSQPEQVSITYEINGQARDLVLLSDPAIKRRLTVIIPGEAPRPKWETKEDSMLPLANTWIFLDGTALSYVSLKERASSIFDTPQAGATLGFAIKACQQTISPRVLDSEKQLVLDDEDWQIGQEVTCNSLGRALAARLLKVPYDDYFQHLVNLAPLSLGQPNKHRLFAIGRRPYESIDTEGMVVY